MRMSVYTLAGMNIETFDVAQLDTTQLRRLAWTEDLAVKQLLDVVVLILAEEYIRTIKQHPEAFSHSGGTS